MSAEILRLSLSDSLRMTLGLLAWLKPCAYKTASTARLQTARTETTYEALTWRIVVGRRREIRSRVRRPCRVDRGLASCIPGARRETAWPENRRRRDDPCARQGASLWPWWRRQLLPALPRRDKTEPKPRSKHRATMHRHARTECAR